METKKFDQSLRYRENQKHDIVLDRQDFLGCIFLDYGKAYRNAEQRSKHHPGKRYIIYEAMAGVESQEYKEFHTMHVNYVEGKNQ